MTGDEDDVRDAELLAALASANPVHDADVPGPDSPQARALFQEITAMEDTAPGWQRPAVLGTVGAAALAIVLGVVLFAGGGGADPAPIATDDPTGQPTLPPVAGMCVELYSLEGLANRDFAFDGTLTSISGDTVTFDVIESFKGGFSGSVTLEGAASVVADSLVSVEGAGLEIGDRALVSGSDNFVWSCGFTMPWDEDTATAWRDTLT